MSRAVLKIEDLHTHFFTREGVVRAVNGVNLTLREESILGVVGESGSGKTVTALSILRLVPYPGRIVKGSVYFNGTDLLSLGDNELRTIRGNDISIVFQDATTALNPVIPVGTQVEEILLAHTSMSKKDARDLAAQLFHQMGLPDAWRILNQYPFQLSGGMAQRVMTSMALALKPKILIADEPTSNLDVTLQAEILQRLKTLRKEQHSSIILITHDMGIIAQMAEDVAVMYAGSVVEYTDTRSLFRRPAHPYTWALFRALPRLDNPDQALSPLRGTPPDMINLPDQCPFLPRCPKATNTCRLNPRPELREVEPGHHVACYNEVRHDWD